MRTICLLEDPNNRDLDPRGSAHLTLALHRAFPESQCAPRGARFIRTEVTPDEVAKYCQAHLSQDASYFISYADLFAYVPIGQHPFVVEGLDKLDSESSPDRESTFLCFLLGLIADGRDHNQLWDFLQKEPGYCRIHCGACLLESMPNCSRVLDPLQEMIGEDETALVFPVNLRDCSARLHTGACEALRHARKRQHSINARKHLDALNARKRQEALNARKQQDALNLLQQIQQAQAAANQIAQMTCDAMDRDNAVWDEVWAQADKMDHEDTIRMIRAISGACPNCGSTCCCCRC
jgi:hypothetical protein